MSKGQNIRLRYWDIAKGIAILLMIIGHVAPLDSVIYPFIYSFHMPLFFIANSFFIKNYNIGETINKSSKTLLKPYAIICLLEAIGYASFFRADGTWLSEFFYRIKCGIVGMSFSNSVLTEFKSVMMVWFVICLFATRIIYITVMHLLRDYHESFKLLILCVMAFVGVYIGTNVAFLPWSLDVALAALPFMWVGDFLKRINLNKFFNIIVFCILLIIWFVLIYMGYHIELAVRKYPGNILCYLCAIAGCLVCLYFSYYIDFRFDRLAKALSWCGKNSIIILGINIMEFLFFDWNSLIYAHFDVELYWVIKAIVEISVIILLTYFFIKIRKTVKFWKTSDVE